MDLNKQKRYDELIEEFNYVYKKLPVMMGNDESVAVAILVSSLNHEENSHMVADSIYDTVNAKAPSQKFKEYRTKLGMTQAEFADQLNISRPYMSEIEHDKRSMSVQTVNRLVGRLGISMSDFFN